MTLALLAPGLGVLSCSRSPADASRATASAATPSATAPGTVRHGDHNPHHGGLVMMKGDDLHYEIVLDPAGRAHRVYFSDAVREDLPAAVASDVRLAIHRPNQPDEIIAMQIDDAGESWIGSGRTVESPRTTTVRVAFSIAKEPYWIDLPFAQPSGR